jgi:hypothetical protein
MVRALGIAGCLSGPGRAGLALSGVRAASALAQVRVRTLTHTVTSAAEARAAPRIAETAMNAEPMRPATILGSIALPHSNDRAETPEPPMSHEIT